MRICEFESHRRTMKCYYCGNLARLKVYVHSHSKTSIRFICHDCLSKVHKDADWVELNDVDRH